MALGDIHFHPAKVSSASPQSNAIQVVSDNSENFREFRVSHISPYVRAGPEDKTDFLLFSKQNNNTKY